MTKNTSEYNKEYYKKNKEKIQARHKLYYANPDIHEKHKEQCKINYKKRVKK